MTVTPYFLAIDVTVSPDLIVYLVDDVVVGVVGALVVGGAVTGAACAGGVDATAVPVSLRTWPGKMIDFEVRPLSASTDAVDR